MASQSNSAAWLKDKAQPLEVGPAPFPEPEAGELIVKNHAAAVNPVDWKVADSGYLIEKYPVVLGTDVAGEVVEVGSDVKQFKKGDRVMAHCIGLMTKKNQDNGFQLYSSCTAILTARLPSDISYVDATVLPLAISTAAAGLYQPGFLELPFPSSSPKSSGKIVLVWGGSSSVGSTAIQLCAASGIEVVATASKHNQEYVKSLGASQVVDYNSSSVVEEVVEAIKATGKEFAGVYDSISLPESLKHCFQIIEKAGGSKNMATVLPPPEDKPSSVNANGVMALSIATQHKEVGEAVWQKWVPEALKDGSLKCLPKALVVGKGLESLQKAMNVQKKGVSARKVVVELS